jgi:hypothetical protein
MTLAEIHPFEAAIQSLRARKILPTSLDSAGLRELGAQFHRQNFTSSQTLLTDLLDKYKADVESIINPISMTRADRVTAANPEGSVNVGLDPAYARTQVKDLLQQLGYTPGEGEAGTIKDLSSDARINLVLKTNVELSQGAGHFIQANDPAVVEAFPAQELVRFEPRAVPRDWETRWRLCAAVVGDVAAARCLEESGRMVALKSSDIWQALGDGEDGSMDTLGNPFPPFAFNSGMWTQDVAYDDAVELGLLADGDEANPAPLDLANLFGVAA